MSLQRMATANSPTPVLLKKHQWSAMADGRHRYGSAERGRRFQLGTTFRVLGRSPTHDGEARLSASHTSARAPFLDEDLDGLVMRGTG